MYIYIYYIHIYVYNLGLPGLVINFLEIHIKIHINFNIMVASESGEKNDIKKEFTGSFNFYVNFKS